VIVVDTSGLLANYDRRDRHNEDVKRILAVPQARVLSPFVLAELGYLVMRSGGRRAELTVLQDVMRGVYRLEYFSPADVGECASIIDRYADLDLGLADASIVLLAHRVDCLDILTLDERHFRAVRSINGKPFNILPIDTGV